MKRMLAAVAVFSAMAATTAEARRGERTGFNFGTTVRVLDNEERTHAGEGSDKNTHLTSSSTQVNPYIGYAFEPFNLGLSFTTESRSSTLKEENADGMTTTTRKTSVDGKGFNLFARFNFGKVFFFEAAGGLYDEKMKVDIEKKTTTEGDAFVGEHDAYEVRGVGPGYNLGAGMELSMGGGFYFTSAYQVRIVQLRDREGGGELGRKRSQTQKREVLFGIAHYAK